MTRCLIVDDANVIRKVARTILESLGYDVSEAENGQEALERCRAEMPELVLLDWHLPVMGALEFLATLKSMISGAARRPYIVYCTTEHDTIDIARALAAGADNYLMKPFNRAMLVAKLGEIKAPTASTTAAA